MIKRTSLFDSKVQRRHGRLGLIALVTALQCAMPWAVEVDDAATANASSSPQAEISWMSGGVGTEAFNEMRKMSAAYNVHVMFTGRDGKYLAAIPFSVSRRDGRIVHSGVTEGPLLYLKLPAGNYQISAEIDGVWQSRRIQPSASGSAVKVRFVARRE